MPKKTEFHGILAVGRTKTDAINNYRLLAMNKGATVQVDNGRNIAFVTQASHADGMFNPMSGNMDLETDDSFIKKLEFASNSSGDVEVNHLVCKSGCGAHLIFDSEDLVKYCPNCTAALSGDDSEEDSDLDLDSDDSEDADLGGDEEELDFEDSDADSDSGDDLDVDSSESADEDTAEEFEDEGEESGVEESQEEEPSDSDEEAGEESAEDTGDDSEEPKDSAKESEEPAEELPEFTEDDGDVVISGDNGKELIVAASSLNEATDLFRDRLPASLSSSASAIEAHYKVCSSEKCGAHILSIGEISECPVCHSAVVEPDTSNPEQDTAAEEPAKDSTEVPEEAKREDTKEDKDANTLELTNEEGNVLDEDTEEVDAMNDVEDAESKSEDLDVSYSSAVAGKAVWTAFYKGVPIAMASKETAGKNADMFDTPTFGHAVLATAKISGVKKALTELGFQPIKHKVSVSKAVRRMVDAQVAEAREALSKEKEQFQERFMAAMAAAAIGLNRGFFADKKNPIKMALWSSMNSAGIRNPEIMIDSVFKSHADAYHKVLFELASDLAAKPLEVQESLAKAIQGMSYQEVSTSSGENIEGRLAGMGTSVSSTEEVPTGAQPAGAVIDRQQITLAVKSLGRRGR